jgi:hypothetical protein
VLAGQFCADTCSLGLLLTVPFPRPSSGWQKLFSQKGGCGFTQGEKAALQECILQSTPPVLHSYSTLLHSYFTLPHPYSARTPLVLHSTPVVLRPYSTVLRSYSAVLQNFFLSRWSTAFFPWVLHRSFMSHISLPSCVLNKAAISHFSNGVFGSPDSVHLGYIPF